MHIIEVTKTQTLAQTQRYPEAQTHQNPQLKKLFSSQTSLC